MGQRRRREMAAAAAAAAALDRDDCEWETAARSRRGELVGAPRGAEDEGRL